MALHQRHREWVEARGLGPMIDLFELDTRERAYLDDADRWVTAKWIVLPYRQHGRIVNHKWRLTTMKLHQMDKGAPLILFNCDDLATPEVQKEGRSVTITEGEWDTLAVKVACGMETPCVSVPNGADDHETDNPWDAKRYEWFQHHRDLLDGVRSFILATDADKAGRFLAADLARLLGPERCMFVTYPEGCKDLNEVLLKCGPEEVERVLAEAKPYPVKNLYTFADFPEPPDMEMIDLGIPGLEGKWGLVVGSVTVVTGWAGIGKTSLLVSAMAHLLKQGIPMVVASFETLPKPILERRLRASFYQTDFKDKRVYARGEADEVFDKNLRIIANMGGDDETDLDVDGLIELAKIAVLRDNARLLIIDPWNEIEHKRRRDEMETDYVGRAIRALIRFARTYHCAVWIVAHPSKPMGDTTKPPSLYSVSGSANFINKPDYGVVVHRPDLTMPQTEVYVRKVRMGYPGKEGKTVLAYNEWTNSYELEAA